MRVLVILAATAALAGCGGVQGAREPSSAGVTFTSTKSADAVAGCITDAWSAALTLPASTNKSPTGWSVVSSSGGAVYGVADVDPRGSGSVVKVGSEFSDYRSILGEKAKACA